MLTHSYLDIKAALVSFQKYVATAFVFVVVSMPVPQVMAAPFDCGTNDCGLLTRGNNPDLVIGRVETIGSKTQMKSVFHWAYSHGYWKTLPADAHDYLSFVQLVSLRIPGLPTPRSVTVLMTRKEFDSGPLKPGALVRYSPHDAAHDAITYKDRSKQAYWVLVGCVAQLCATGDTACAARYQSGVFNRHTGAQLHIENNQPMVNGVVIDPQTLLPKDWHKRVTQHKTR